MEKPDYKIILGTIFALTAIEISAMFYGFNGTLRTMIVGIIAGLAGWTMPIPNILKGGKKNG